MKRELAALEIDSPVLESLAGKTRSSKLRGGDECGRVPERLVYKRTRRSLHVRTIHVLPNNNSSNALDSGVGNSSSMLMDFTHPPDIVAQPSSLLGVKLNQGHTTELLSQGNLQVAFSTKDLGLVSSLSAEDNGLTNSVNSSLKRFTRSTLKSKPTTQPVVPNGEAMVQPNAQVDQPPPRSEIQIADNNGQFSTPSLLQHPGGYTCRSLKPEAEGIGSCLIQPSDSGHTESVVNDGNAEAVFEKDVEESLSATPKRKLEMKMSKQIALANTPTTVKELFETGLLEGCPVYYNGGKGSKLRGRIRGLGILCSCGLCQGCKVIPPSLFEIHACNSYKRAVQYICLENGRSFIQILKECKNTRLSTLEATVQNAIGPLPERKLLVCHNCDEPFFTMDAETSEAVCSLCVMSNLSPIGPVFSSRKPCRSDFFVLCNSLLSVSVD